MITFMVRTNSERGVVGVNPVQAQADKFAAILKPKSHRPVK